MSGLTMFTPEQIAAAPQLEPSFEMTLRAADISEEVIAGFRVHRIKNAATFAAMDTTLEELKDTVRVALTQQSTAYRTKVEWANIHNAWLASKVNLEVKTQSLEHMGNPFSISRKIGRLCCFSSKHNMG